MTKANKSPDISPDTKINAAIGGAGDNLIGLGLGWFSPQFLPLGMSKTVNSNKFKASRINPARSGITSHPQTNLSSISARKKLGHQTTSQRHQQAVSIPNKSTGHQTPTLTAKHPGLANLSSLIHNNCTWDKPRPVPKSLAHVDPGGLDQSGDEIGESAGFYQTTQGSSQRGRPQPIGSSSTQLQTQTQYHLAHQSHPWTSSPLSALYSAIPRTAAGVHPTQQYQQYHHRQQQTGPQQHHHDLELSKQHFGCHNNDNISSNSRNQIQKIASCGNNNNNRCQSVGGGRCSCNREQAEASQPTLTKTAPPPPSSTSHTIINHQLPAVSRTGQNISGINSSWINNSAAKSSCQFHLGNTDCNHLHSALSSQYAHLAPGFDFDNARNSIHNDTFLCPGLTSGNNNKSHSLVSSSISASFAGCQQGCACNFHSHSSLSVHDLHTSPNATSQYSSLRSLHYPVNMAVSFQDEDDELVRMQELSNTWEPEATGPMVSERLPSSNLTKEYADADPVYQIKTASLPQKYAQYRTCRGDGHCGWRAIVFSYYENLLRIGNKQKMSEEEQRIKSLTTLLEQTGISEHIFEDWLEEAISLLREMSNGGQEAGLLKVFNDPARSMDIITFFKTLTGAWLRTHAEDFQPYLETSVDEYCKTRVDPANSEIEHIGLTALMDLLIKPAGIGGEVIYLDRNIGEEVISYSYEPVNQDGQIVLDHPWFRLLYRPGHYDILYKLEDLPAPVAIPPVVSQDIYVGFTHGATSQMDTPAALPFIGTNFEIPGMEFFLGQQNLKLWNTMGSSFEYQAPTPQPPTPVEVMTRTLPIRDYPHVRTSSTSVSDYFSRSNPPSNVMTPTSPNSPPAVYGSSVIDASRFRPSKFEFEADFMAMNSGTPIYQTSIFKNSHFNVAHFNNPEFAPEQWQPEKEYPSDKRKRSS